MQEKWVAAVVGDIGGANEVIPGMLALSKRGIQIRWFLDPGPQARANIPLDKANISYERDLPSASDNPSAIVVGTSATAIEAQIAWTRFGREKRIPVIWVEDLFGTGSREATQCVSPDVMLTIHPLAEDIARRVRPHIKTATVGKPSFKRIPDLARRSEEIRSETRNTLEIREDKFLITWIFSGEPRERAWIQLHHFEAIADFLKQINGHMMPRTHPKHPDRADLDTEIHRILGVRHVDPSIDLDRAIIASDLLYADWGSTDALTAIFTGVPAATLLFPDDTDRRIKAGYKDGIPPILCDNEAWGLASVEEMATIALLVHTNPGFARSATEFRKKQFSDMLIPDADQRIAQQVLSLT